MEVDPPVCVNCKEHFKERPLGYLRVSLASRLGTTGLSVREGLNYLLPQSSFTTPDVKRKGAKFLCTECCHLLNKATVGKTAETQFFSRTAVGSYVENKKRKQLASTPSKSPFRGKRRKVDVSTSPFPDSTAGASGSTATRVGKIKSWKNRAKELITISKYKTMILLLYKSSPTAAKDIEEVVHTLVRREVAGFALCNRIIKQQVSLENVENFNWDSVLHEFHDHLPVLFNSVAAACSREQVNTLLTDKTAPSRPGIGNTIATALFIRSHQRYKFLAALHAVAMWRSGGSHKLFEYFNHLGVTLGVDAARNTVDRLREAYDAMILDWKTQIEETLGEKVKAKSASRSLKFDDDDEDMDVDVDMVSTNTETVPPGYVFCWDNVQIEAHARHQTKEKQNKVHLWALSFAVENRVTTTQLENLAEENQLVDAKRIAMSCFLPSVEDWNFLKGRMVIIVKRIMCQNFSFLQEGLGTVVPSHIKHKHSSVMNQKSKIVNLGVLETNPSSTDGVVKVLESLEQYVPLHPNDAPFKCVCFGDGLSVERMVDAKKSRATGVDGWERMEMFEPSPQEFHKRMINMQDTFNEFFSGRSAADRGTMFHIKNSFNRRNVKKSVKDAFNHDSDFLRFTTEGYVCLFASKLMDTSMDEAEVNMSEEEKWQLLERVSTEIVDKVWHQVPGESILEVITAKIPSIDDNDEDDDNETDKEHYEFCCHEDTGESMVECSNPNCPEGQWFHFDCKDITDVPEGDWWCCQACCETESSIHCVCKKMRPDLEMKRCARKENCTRGEWFHKTCVKLDIGSMPPGTRWFCSLTCKKGSKSKSSLKPIEKDDHVYNYSCALTWRGLCDMVKRDAVREGDGEAMICYWRIDMTDFWSKNHYKYLTLGHRLLAGVNGWLPKRLAADITFNRTANLQGREGTNLELDLVNEFLNNDFKENLKHARGMYTQKHVARTAQIVGSLGKSIEKIYEKQVIGTYIHSSTISHAKSPNFRNELIQFVEEYEGDKLVEKVPEREHAGYPGYSLDLSIMNPGQLKKRLKTYSAKIERQRFIRPNRKDKPQD